MIEILKLLEKDSRLSTKQIAAMLGREEAEVQKIIEQSENDGIILGRTAFIDYDKAGIENVMALIELKIAPQHGDGFDRIAQRVYQYDEVESLFLMSGEFDLAVMMSMKTMKDVAQFVYAHLATIEGVTATKTHFIMKKYKEKNCIFDKEPEQEERMHFV